MKKLLILPLALLSIIGLTACDSGTKLSAEDAKKEIKTVIDATNNKGKYAITLSSNGYAKMNLTSNNNGVKMELAPTINFEAKGENKFDGNNSYELMNYSLSIDGLDQSISYLLSAYGFSFPMVGKDETFVLKGSDFYTIYEFENGKQKNITTTNTYTFENFLEYDEEQLNSDFIDLSQLKKSDNKLYAGSSIINMDKVIDEANKDIEKEYNMTLTDDNYSIKVNKLEVLLNDDNSIKSVNADIDLNMKIKVTEDKQTTTLKVDANFTLSADFTYDNISVELPAEYRITKIA